MRITVIQQPHAPLGLEQRFQKPDGWRWHSFKRNGRNIRFGSVFPKDTIPDAVIVCLHGVREFSEKYFELSQWCLNKNLAFWTCDWVGQGLSSRYLENPQKRHGINFDEDIEDLQSFVLGYIKHSSVHPDKGRIPMCMIAHSMGANIGMRYLQKYPDTFTCAAFTSPMISINVFANIPNFLSQSVTWTLNTLMGTSYVPGGKDWEERKNHITLTSDPIRKKLQTLWAKDNVELRCGDVTLGWLYHAQRSCIALQKDEIYSQIQTPCLFGIPKHETLVNNKIAKNCIKKMPNAEMVTYDDAFHEILMESDHIRDDFLHHFYKMIDSLIIKRPESMKTF